MEEKVSILIKEFKLGDKGRFLQIVEKMTPLINKYVRLLYKDEKEDMHSEFVLSLLEAVHTIKYYEDEGPCIYFLSKALRIKFLELYKKSKLHSDRETVVEDEVLANIDVVQSDYDDCITREDLINILGETDGKQRSILCEIIFKYESDAKIAEKNAVSRQYVNRVRRKFYDRLRKQYFQ